MQKLLTDIGQTTKVFLDGYIGFLNIDAPILNIGIGFTVLGFAIGVIRRFIKRH